VILLMVLGGGGATLHLEDAAICKSAWQPLTAPKPFDETSALVYQAGTIYYSSLNAQAALGPRRWNHANGAGSGRVQRELAAGRGAATTRPRRAPPDCV